MVQDAVNRLCCVSEKLTDDLDANQLAAATKHIDALKHPLKPNDIRALLPLLPQDGDTTASLNWSLLHTIEAVPGSRMWDLLGDQTNNPVRILRLRLGNENLYPSI